MNTYCPKPADLLFCHNDSFVGRAIRWFTRRRGEAPTYANHIAGVVDRRHVKNTVRRFIAAKEIGQAAKVYEALIFRPFSKEASA